MRARLVTLLVALGLAGCTAEPERLTTSGAMQRAGKSMGNDASVRFRTTMKGRLGGNPTNSYGQGVIDIRGRRLWMNLVANVGERAATLELIAEENAFHSRGRGCLGGGQWGVTRAERRDGIGAEAAEWGSRDPLAQLAMLAMAAKVGRIGTETVGGVKTTRYGGEVPRFNREPIDIWVDEQWRIRRLRTVMTRPAADGVPERRETNTTEFYDYSRRRETIPLPVK